MLLPDGTPVRKPGQQLDETTRLVLSAPPQYVSRGAGKLLAAIEAFQPNLQGVTALDLGASTGGFTDEVEKRKVEVKFSEEADRKLTAEEKKELAAVLKEDPRPAYQEDPEREYVFAFAGKQIHFRVEKGILTVSEVE